MAVGKPWVLRVFRTHAALACAAIGAVIGSVNVVMASGKAAGPGSLPIPTTQQDFFMRGTQPLGAGLPQPLHPILASTDCISCHASYGEQDSFLMVEEMKTWAGSMMAQSAHDPIFLAALTVTNQSAAESGTYCLRCHAPVGFLNGHAVPADGSALTGADLEGVNCNLCHRLVDPVYVAGVSPAEDETILNDLTNAGLMPPQATNSRYLIDPTDSRRGPFNDIPVNLHPGDPQPQILTSSFHMHSELCWTCHDVSNPIMTKQGNSFALNDLNAPHPTGEQTQMLPLHRTYSEWKNSYYSTIGVQHNGRFGGNHPTGVMKVCQDCHMPRVVGYGSSYEIPPFVERPDVPQHSFIGSNYWVLDAIRVMDADGNGRPDYPDSVTYLSEESVAAAHERVYDFLQKASDAEVSVQNNNLKVRLYNFTGHKLPTGFPDGRRIWINVRFYNCQQQVIQERGAYDFETATLTPDTKVYEMQLGIQGAAYAQSIGQPEGHTFHFMLANTVLKDNRIPPAGFSNSLAIQAGSGSVGAVYSNGQNWDDTLFSIPQGAGHAVVTVYYQVMTKEFIEFLRDANTTDNRGQVAYDLWQQFGMAAPAVMDMVQVPIYRPEDINKDTVVDVSDLLAVISAWGSCPATPAPCPADVNKDRIVNVSDLLAILAAWGPC